MLPYFVQISFFPLVSKVPKRTRSGEENIGGAVIVASNPDIGNVFAES